jgi:hypothetical protein
LGHSEGARKSVAKQKKSQILLDNVHKAKYRVSMMSLIYMLIGILWVLYREWKAEI